MKIEFDMSEQRAEVILSGIREARERLDHAMLVIYRGGVVCDVCKDLEAAVDYCTVADSLVQATCKEVRKTGGGELEDEHRDS